MLTSSGSTGGDAKTIISPNTSFGDIIIVLYSQIFFSRNVGNSIKCEKNITTPPPQTTPTFEIQNQTKGIEDIMDIDSNCPYLLFGETTSN